MKPTDKPIQRFRYTITLDFMIEETTLEAAKRWNENHPEHMQHSLDEQEIALYHEFQKRLFSSPRFHDWVVAWLHADLGNEAHRAMVCAFGEDPDSSGQIEKDLIREMIAESDDPETFAEQFIWNEDNQGRVTSYELDYHMQLDALQWQPIQMTEQVFNAQGELERETSFDLAECGEVD